MRLTPSDTGVASRSRKCGRATATWVVDLLTLKNCKPGAAQQLAQWRPRELLRRRAAEGVSVNRLDDVGEMNFAKVLFHFLATAKSLRLRHIQTGEFGLPALLFDPLFDD